MYDAYISDLQGGDGVKKLQKLQRLKNKKTESTPLYERLAGEFITAVEQVFSDCTFSIEVSGVLVDGQEFVSVAQMNKWHYVCMTVAISRHVVFHGVKLSLPSPLHSEVSYQFYMEDDDSLTFSGWLSQVNDVVDLIEPDVESAFDRYLGELPGLPEEYRSMVVVESFNDEHVVLQVTSRGQSKLKKIPYPLKSNWAHQVFKICEKFEEEHVVLDALDDVMEMSL